MPEFIDPVFAKTSQNARFLLSENERFGLVFVKTGVYKFRHCTFNKKNLRIFLLIGKKKVFPRKFFEDVLVDLVSNVTFFHLDPYSCSGSATHDCIRCWDF